MTLSWSPSTCAAASTLLILTGCGQGASGASTSSAPGALPSVAAASAATPAKPVVPAGITPSPKPPFETLMFTETGKKGANSWPKFEAHNLGTNPVTFVTLYGYAYDKTGKLVARTTTPYSWNTRIKPGAKADWDVDVGAGAKVPPPEAVAFELCYNAIKFEGDTKNTENAKLCGERRPKGGR